MTLAETHRMQRYTNDPSILRGKANNKFHGLLYSQGASPIDKIFHHQRAKQCSDITSGGLRQLAATPSNHRHNAGKCSFNQARLSTDKHLNYG